MAQIGPPIHCDPVESGLFCMTDVNWRLIEAENMAWAPGMWAGCWAGGARVKFDDNEEDEAPPEAR